jgi:menaquinone-dependent protoporphyrinogen oxidase
MKAITRREFIITGSVLAGVAASCLAPGSGALSASKAHAARVDFPESNCGPKNKAGKKVLVAYASYCGTTGGVAEAIGRVFCDAGVDTDIRLVKNVDDVSAYSAVVVGSAVRSTSWYPEAIEFVRKNRQTLSGIPVAYFLTCLALYEDSEASLKVALSYMDTVLNAVPDVRPLDTGLFAGVLDYGKMNIMIRMVMKSKMKSKGVPEGDFRDWNAIRSWAGGLTSRLVGTGTI